MVRKKESDKRHVVIFVEGDTDMVFFTELLRYYRQQSLTPIVSCEVQNMKGVSKYNAKFALKLKNNIIPKAKAKGFSVSTVCCSYDTDVFEYAEHPVVDWNGVRTTVAKLGVKQFVELKVEKSIEDWLLDDMEGLCAFLGIKNAPQLTAGSGFEKLSRLFRKANAVYDKGYAVGKFVSSLDMGIIRNKRKAALKELEEALSVKIE